MEREFSRRTVDKSEEKGYGGQGNVCSGRSTNESKSRDKNE